MRILVSVILFALTCSAFGGEDQIIYYAGIQVRTSLFGQPQVTEDLVLKKSFLPSKGMLVEIACMKKPGSAAKLSPVYMKVENQTILAISSDEKFSAVPLSGTGALEGSPWDWNYLKFSMKFNTPAGTARIEDENWVSGPYLIAIKDLYWQDAKGGPELKSGIITAKVREVGEADYNAKSKEMGCP